MSRLMKTMVFGAVLVLSLAAGPGAVAGGNAAGVVEIPGGTFTPFYAMDDDTDKGRDVSVQPFRLDKYPVTNADFLAFVEKNPRWQRDRIPAIFARSGYLQHWSGPLALGEGEGAAPAQPVTRVSWFAANAYCEAQGMRLPSEAEWEFAARAGQVGPDGPSEPGFTERILRWYSRPGTDRLPDIGHQEPNYWGVVDLHGLVWEWVADFDAGTAAGRGGNSESTSFCGGAALEAADAGDYASFMRHAFRSSIKPPSTLRTLGFRCAGDKESR